MKRPPFSWDPDADAAYIKLLRYRPYVSAEVQPGIIVDYDKDDRVVGIEILDFSTRIGSFEGIIAKLTKGRNRSRTYARVT